MTAATDVVHVMGAKKGGRTGDLEDFYCCRDDPWPGVGAYVEVVYHEESGYRRDEWWCPACGVNTEETEGVFVTPLVE